MREFKNVGIYMRLSKDDGDKLESESITNQRKLLERYADDVGIKINKEYIDDGFSGTNFNRPKFKEMINDVILGKIDTIIVKDLSRFARESIDASEYIEKFFPEHNVRFIAVLDNVDTYLENLANILIEFKLYNNQKFAKDISDKMKKSKRNNMEKGLYMATYPPYGYVKDKENRGKLIVDEKSSKIVKKIYKFYLEGKTSVYIAKYLTSNKVKTPAEYYNIVQYKKTNMYSVWKPAQILRILKNQVYIGNTVRNVENKISYRKKGKRKTRKEEWIITQNTHKAIIKKEDFDKVQKMIESKNGSAYKLKYNYLFRPYMYCKNCGRKFSFSTRHEKLVDISCPKAKIGCCEHFYYNYFKLEEKILNDIKKHYNELFNISQAGDNIVTRIMEEKNTKIDERLKKMTYEYNRINDTIDSIYMNRLDSLITEDEYISSTKELKERKEVLYNTINECKKIKENFNEEELLKIKKFLNKNNDEIKNNMNNEILDKLIYKIEISKNEIVINYKFKFI